MLQLMPARIEDQQLVQQLGIDTYREHYSTIWGTAALAEYLDKNFGDAVLKHQLTDRNIQYYIAKFNKDPAGIVKLKYDCVIPAPPFDRGLELEKIYLLRKYTGLGLGSEIFNVIAGLAISRKDPFIWLDVLKSNTRAKKLYQAQGFVTTGEIEFSTDLQKIDMWVMRKQLTGTTIPSTFTDPDSRSSSFSF